MSGGRTGEGRKGAGEGRKESVNAGRPTVCGGLTSFWSSMQRTWRCPPGDDLPAATANPANGDEMGVLVYIALTVAVFALLGLMQRLVERL